MTAREFEVMPEGMLFYNGSGTPCDMLVGPCSCGATHSAVDWAERCVAAERRAQELAQQVAAEHACRKAAVKR